jgi:hypothetical protein
MCRADVGELYVPPELIQEYIPLDPSQEYIPPQNPDAIYSPRRIVCIFLTIIMMIIMSCIGLRLLMYIN